MDDNVFTRTSVKETDIALQIQPHMRIRKENRFNAVMLDMMARTSTYLRLTDQNSTEYRLQGTYTRGTTGPNSITIDFGYRRETILRGTVENDLVGGSPLMRRVLHGSLTGRKQFNRLSVDTQIIGVRQRYENVQDSVGESISQHFRNVTRFGLRGVGYYELSSRTSIFTSLEYDRYNYAKSALLENRDAENLSGTAGIRYELTRILYAQLGVGYRRYDFKERALSPISGLAVSGHLRYFPSRVLSIRGMIEQSNTTSPYDIVGAVTLTTTSVEVEYEMRRSLSFLAISKFALEDYAKQDYAARRVEVSAGPRLRFNRWLSADASIGCAKRFVNGAAPFEPYTQFYGLLSITFAR